jgi:integrase
MSTINIQKNGSYLVSIHKNNKRVRRAFKTKHDADLFLAENQVRSLKNNTNILHVARAETPKTVGELRDRVLEGVWKGTRAEKTVTTNSQSIVDFFGKDTELEAELFSQENIDQCIEHFKFRGNKKGTINLKLSALNRMLNYAKERGWLNVSTKIRGLRQDRGRIRFLSREEEVTLLEMTNQLKRPDHADLWMFLIDTGARVGEALKMEWKDVRFVSDQHKHNEVTFWHTKNGEFRTVPMTSRVADMMMTRKAAGKPYPFEMSQSNVNYVWMCLKLNNPAWTDDTEFVPHALRHTCASRLVQRGVPLYTVMHFLGHKDLHMTTRYAHLTSANFGDAVAALETNINTSTNE